LPPKAIRFGYDRSNMHRVLDGYTPLDFRIIRGRFDALQFGADVLD
jgi:hypothetical protein